MEKRQQLYEEAKPHAYPAGAALPAGKCRIKHFLDGAPPRV